VYKKTSILSSAFLITCTVSLNVFANIDETIDSNKISKSNQEFLFKSATNILVLDEEEMKKTKGEILRIIIPIFITWGKDTAEAPTLDNCSSCHKQ